MSWKNSNTLSKYKLHWPFYVTGPILAVVLLFFWYFNDLSILEDTVINNPNVTFSLVIFGAFLSAYVFGDFGIKLPKTYSPLIMGFAGGFLYGVGAKIASWSIANVVVFGLFGIFVMSAFLLLEGLIFIGFMFLGGYFGSKLYVYLLKKTAKSEKRLTISAALTNELVTETVFQIGILLLLLVFLMNMKGLNFINIIFLLIFGVIIERGTLCLSAMMKEVYIAKTSTIWKSVFFTVMILSVLYHLLVQLGIIAPYSVKPQLNIVPLMIGSVLIGFGYIFSDGCGMGNLWKIGEGNVINMVSFIGSGIGFMVPVKLMLGDVKTTNYLGHLINPWIVIGVMWIVGIYMLVRFKGERYEE